MAGILLGAIELELTRARMSASRFGREVARDPRLVFDLRNGRRVRVAVERRVRDYLAILQQESVQ